MNQRQQTSCFSAIFDQAFSPVGPSPKGLGQKTSVSQSRFYRPPCANARLSGLETKEGIENPSSNFMFDILQNVVFDGLLFICPQFKISNSRTLTVAADTALHKRT